MRTSLAVAAALSGLAIVGLAIQALHAQARPPVYSVSEILVSDLDGYQKNYAPIAVASIKASGGTIIAGGPSMSILGETPTGRVVIIKWDSVEQIKAWQNSDAYTKAREIGDKVAKWRTIYGVNGSPQ